MKKISILAIAALSAAAANAQYNCDPTTAAVVSQNPSSVDYIVLSDGAIADFTKAGAKVNYIGPSPEKGRNLWYWAGFNPADDSYPRVDMEEGGYTAVSVTGTPDWSGAGFAVAAPGINISHFNDDTHFHLAYMSPTANGPASIAIILLDGGDHGSKPAKMALGTAFDDNGTIFPSVGDKISDDWQGIDISFATLKKLWPEFTLANTTAWEGNSFSWLGGNVAGQTMAFDALYFYNTGDATGVDSAVADSVRFIVTPHTLNVAGAAGISLYNLAGQLAAQTAGTTLGLDKLPKGVYVAVAAGQTRKIVIR